MAMILDFKAGSDLSPKTPKLRLRGRVRTAEIVIFPGVRYERWEENPAPVASEPDAGRRKRAE